MKKKLEPRCKQCRREGEKLFLKGDRCFSAKCAIVKRNYAPGLHGVKGRTKLSDFGIRLREKQKVKRMYMLNEKQLQQYFDSAFGKTGDTGLTLAQMLERRLDNVIYRLKLAPSRSAARQMVSHGHFMVNGKKMNIPSYLVKVKDEISIKANKEQKGTVKDWPGPNVLADVPAWVSLDTDKKKAKILHVPADKDLSLGVDMNLIIEYYSR